MTSEGIGAGSRRVVVTGGSGKAGRWVVRDLRERGHDVLSVDLVSSADRSGPSLVVDLTDLGQCHDVMAGADSVVHLAAIPAWGIRPEAETFRVNVSSTFNVFSAATAHGVRRVVYASSETVHGVPLDRPGPSFAPIDETIEPDPQSSYALSKVVGEEMAAYFARRFDTSFVGLRFSNILEPDEYAAFPGYWEDARLRSWNLWSYVDSRDAAASVAAALSAAVVGAEVCLVAAADTVMTRASAELLAEVFPQTPLRHAVEGCDTLLAIDHARAVLGFQPAHSWRDHVRIDPGPAGGDGLSEGQS